MKKMRHVKAIVALALAMVMLFGIFPPVKSQAAIGLTPGESMAGATNVPKYFTEYYGRATRDGVWYKFKTNSTVAFYTIEVKSLSAYNVTARLMEASEEEVGVSSEIDKNGTYVFNMKLKKNTWYYLRLNTYWSSDAGNVKVKISWRKDAEPDTKATAKKIALATNYIGRVDGIKSNDNDYYKFTPTVTGKYVVTVKNLDSAKRIRMSVLTSNLTSIDTNDSIKKNKTHKATVKLVKGRTYYVRIKSTLSTGRYKLRIDQK